jgi:hypothetical protein
VSAIACRCLSQSQLVMKRTQEQKQKQTQRIADGSLDDTLESMSAYFDSPKLAPISYLTACDRSFRQNRCTSLARSTCLLHAQTNATSIVVAWCTEQHLVFQPLPPIFTLYFNLTCFPHPAHQLITTIQSRSATDAAAGRYSSSPIERGSDKLLPCQQLELNTPK